MLPGYLKVEAESQGTIAGGCDRMGHEETIFVKAYDHAVTIPSDTLTGKASGSRVHGPFVVTIEVDKALPLLYQALCNGENLTSVKLENYRISADGTEEHFWTTELTNAILVNVQPKMGLVDDPGQMKMPFLADLSFRYSKVEWRHEIDGTNFADSWKD